MATGAARGSDEYGVKEQRDIFIAVRDGTRLCADIYRPHASGRFPALLSLHPYCKDVENTLPLGRKLKRMSAEFASVEAGDHEFWASRGYAHVIVDVRGSAKSEGRHHGLFSPQEAQDGYDLVEWIAQQPWCDGNVGMCGISYLGIIQYFVAAQQPPHLKAIFPHDAWGDTYRDILYHGGIPSVFGFVLDAAIPYREGVASSPSLYGKEALAERVRSLLEDESTSFAKSPAAIRALNLPHVHPISFDTYVNREDNAFWRERSPVHHMHRINVPTYLGAELHGYPTAMHVPGVTWGWETIPAPKKIALRPCKAGGLDRPFYEIHDEMLRWFDHWLRGIDTGIMDEPAVKVWVRGREQWRFADEWPIQKDTEWTKLFLRAGGRLAFDEPPAAAEPPAKMHYEPAQPVTINAPLSPRPEFLSYATEPFERDVEVVGPMALYLQASLDGPDGDFIVAVKEVSAEGAELVLTRGWLKASHREVDPEKSKPWRPFHPHTRAVPVKPGERQEFAIEVRPMANLFRKGSRLKLEIWPWDFPNEPGYDWTLYWGKGHHVPYGKPVSYEIFHTPEAPSYLLIPVMRS
ncbi:MAG: hypothetical protein A3G80_09855 [Betaproteobacteria bacterium RIFCSPLOWO2_12_FULL_62_13b]|nr:MAG: hypothetical protein A3G80_09855 [Betaproteobacteria bacterium RIFCSPLOWO2_12_FULL_62_13b]